MIKLVVSDIDGTLLPEGTDQLNPELYEIVRELKAKGILFAGASGRQYASMRHVFEPIAHDMIFIAENGTNVMCRETTMASEYIDPALAEEVLCYLRGLKDCEITVSTPEVMYVENNNEAFIKLLTEGYHNRVQPVDDLMPYCRNTNKISVYRREGVETIEDEIMELFAEKLHTTLAGKIWIDFMKSGTDKGLALTTIQKQLNILPEETMAFGDNCNDIGMLRCAGESYAVENAHPQLKAAAKYITKSYKENGVINTIRERLL